MHCFPKDSAKPPAPKRAKSKAKTDPEGNAGKLQPLAASVLMKVMYAARTARFDLLRAVSRLACFITKWDTKCDKALHRLMCYIHSSYGHRQCGWVGDVLTDVSPHVYADADLGGCTTSNRSTSGRHLNLEYQRQGSCWLRPARDTVASLPLRRRLILFQPMMQSKCPCLLAWTPGRLCCLEASELCSMRVTPP